LFVARADEVEAILVFGVQHDGFRAGLEGDRVAYPYDETVTDEIRKLSPPLWRGDLAKRRTAPLGCAAAPKELYAIRLTHPGSRF
jgi:hypothetical protein